MQGTVKTGKVIPGDHNDKFKYYLDRNFGNFREGSPPFLVGMWLYAATICPSDASKLGCAWLVFRVLYTFMWGFSGSPAFKVGFAPFTTMPAMFIALYLLLTPLLWHGLVFGIKLRLQPLVGGYLPLAVLLQGIPCLVVIMGKA